MNKQRLLELMKVNLRYASPQVTAQSRKKGKSGRALTRSLLNQYGLSMLIFLFVYGLTMFMLDFSQLPGFFTYYTGLFSLLGFSQGITAIYNVFFESQDLPAYLPLPIRQGEIFIAKIAVVALAVMPFVFPMLVVFLLTSWRSGLFLPLGILIALLLFLMMLMLIFGLCSLVVFGLTRTAFFRQHKKIVTTGLLVVSMGITLVGILFMNRQEVETGAATFDRHPIQLLLPLFQIASRPFSINGLLSLVSLVALLAVVALIVKAFILPKLYEQLSSATLAQGNIKRQAKANQSLSQLLVSYNLQLLKDPNLVMQVLSSSILMPLVFVVTFAFSGLLNIGALELRFIGVVFLVGMALAVMMVNQTSFVSNLISLDQENFHYMQSLPISMKYYLKQKFGVGLAIQVVLSGAVAVIGGFSTGMSWPFVLSLAAGAILGTYLLCLRFFARDFKLLLLDWTDINQLFSRGSGNLGLVLGMLGGMLASALVIGLYSFLAMVVPFWPLTSAVVIALVAISYAWISYYQQHFWGQFYQG